MESSDLPIANNIRFIGRMEEEILFNQGLHVNAKEFEEHFRETHPQFIVKLFYQLILNIIINNNK